MYESSVCVSEETGEPKSKEWRQKEVTKKIEIENKKA